MDEYVKEILQKWGLDQLSEIFEANQIDENVFRKLNAEDIKELIPILGLRKKFIEKYDEMAVLEACSNDLILDKSDTISINSADQSESVSDQSFTDNANIVPVQYYSEKATLGLPYKPLPIPDDNNSVKALLDSCEEGQLIYASYGKDKQFRRGELARLVIKNELKKSASKSISTERFKRLAIEINDIFLHESPDVYYTPYMQIKNSKKTPLSARGKLWSSYITIRRNIRKYSVSTTNEKETSAVNENSFVREEYILWLKNNSEPFPKVVQYWNETFSERIKSVTNISEYFKTFPCLNHPLGYLLLENDFNHIYPGKENIFLLKFAKIAPAIFQILSSRSDHYIKEKLKEFNSHNKEPSEDDICFLALRLLPVLLQSPLKSKGADRWKPSKIELQDGFILNVNDTADIKPALERRSAKYLALKLTAQPVPITVGLENISSYVSINETLYKVETPMRAVELCFKVFHALNANYPYEVEACWTYIQKAIFDIKTNFDKSFTSVNTLISDINFILSTHTAV